MSQNNPFLFAVISFSLKKRSGLHSSIFFKDSTTICKKLLEHSLDRYELEEKAAKTNSEVVLRFCL